jgi:hypothetical protein
VLLRTLIGWQRANLIFYTGRRISGEEAFAWGLGEVFTDQDNVRAAALELAKEIVENAPLAVQSTRATMRAGIAETDPPGVSRTKLSASIAEHMPDEEERHQAFAAVDNIPSIKNKADFCFTWIDKVFELPAPGTFEFVRGSQPTVEGERLELMGLLLEAMRRYDELRRARALVPDEALLKAGDVKPTAPAEERDGELVRHVWARVRAGATAAECEQGVEVDSFRVRTLLAHWIDEGAARIETAA